MFLLSLNPRDCVQGIGKQVESYCEHFDLFVGFIFRYERSHRVNRGG